MKKIVLLALIFSVLHSLLSAQTTSQEPQMNSSAKMLAEEDKLTIGGYGQIDFNQPIVSGQLSNGVIDVHRLVLMFGYKFDERTSFITEIEIEHVNEVFVEQAFVDYKVLPWLNVRGGLMLIPMGIINEYHEPPTFNGVERPNLDNYLVPSTWREIGVGITGQFTQAGLGYQLYLVNGFLGSDDGAAKLSGSSLFRSGRQKGAKSVFTSPNLAFRLNYTGIPGLNGGISGYFGKSQSTLPNGINSNDPQAMSIADSSIVGMNMLGIDARYSIKGFSLKAQLIAGSVSNANEYNMFHGADLGSAFSGYYVELSYDIFNSFNFTDDQLIPFIRFENYDTHKNVDPSISRNLAYNRTDITFGIGWKPNSGLIYKIDYQLFSNESMGRVKSQFNAGIGIWF